MHSIILLLACNGSSVRDTATFQPAINEMPNVDRVGTYAHTLPNAPKTIIFLGDSITAGADSPNDDEDYARLLVNNTNT